MFGLYYRALMASELPEQIECRQLATGTGTVSGVLSPARLSRIDEPYRVVGPVTVNLTCHHRAGGGFQVEARIEAPLEARCQRCLEWTAWPVNVTMALVAHSKAPPAQDHDEEDSVELVDGMLPLREVIEDEVLLSCPLAPLHARKDCPAGGGVEAPAIASDRKQPFADLAQLLKSREQE